MIGALGLLLPVIVVVGDGLLSGKWFRGSLSDYYYSGTRDLFVGVLCVCGLFLITYRVSGLRWENWMSALAGIGAAGVALLPKPTDSTTTPVQDFLGEGFTGVLHFAFAAVFIGAAGVVSCFFGWREGRRTQTRATGTARQPPQFWRNLHYGCALCIVAAGLFILITTTFNVLDAYSVLVGEIVAIVAFGLSWLLKGLELDVLRGP